MAYAYGAEATVIAIINATTGDTNAFRVPRALAQAEALVNQEIKPYATVPITDAEHVALLKDICNDWAAGLCRGEDTNPTGTQTPPPNLFIERAKEALCRYLWTKWNADCPFAAAAAATEGGDGGAAAEGAPFSGAIAATEYKTDEIRDTWDE